MDALFNHREDGTDVRSPKTWIMNTAGAPDALISFLRIAQRWKLGAREQAVLLGVDQHEFEDLTGEADAAELSHETLERISYLLAIDAALQLLLPIQERADSWVHQLNAAPIFAGRSALEYMLSGRLCDVRGVASYLSALCGGDFS